MNIILKWELSEFLVVVIVGINTNFLFNMGAFLEYILILFEEVGQAKR